MHVNTSDIYILNHYLSKKLPICYSIKIINRIYDKIHLGDNYAEETFFNFNLSNSKRILR